MDASRELPGGHAKLIDTLSEPIIPPLSDALPLHPHNAFLQWRVELGLPATLLCALVVAWVLWRSGASGPAPVRAASLACAAAGLVIALLGYGVWQAWWMSTMWLAAALLVRPFPARV
jgi:O-antigen ligase